MHLLKQELQQAQNSVISYQCDFWTKIYGKYKAYFPALLNGTDKTSPVHL